MARRWSLFLAACAAAWLVCTPSPAAARSIGSILSLIQQALGGKPLPTAGPTSDGHALIYDSTTGALVWEAPASGGTNLTGLGTDNRVARWNGTDTLQSSGVTVDDSDNVSGVTVLTAGTRVAGPAGSASASSIGLDANDGWFFVDNTSIAATVSGTEEMRLTSTALDRGADQVVFGASIGSPDVGIVRDAAGRLRVSDGSTGTGDLLVDDVLTLFATDSTGFAFVRAGANTLRIMEGDNTDLTSSDVVTIGSTGPSMCNATTSPTNVAYSFVSDPNTGLSRVEADAPAIAAEGQWRTVWSNSTTLPDNTATTLVTIPLASGAQVAGQLDIFLTVTDGTDHQSSTHQCNFAAVDKAGTLTSQATADGDNVAQALSTGTLTTGFSIADGTNAISIQFTANSSLASPTITCRWVMNLSHSTAGVAVTIP